MVNSFEISRESLSRYLLNDFLASIVVFLVALPLCMGIAIAAGMPPATGIITGVVGGLLVGAIAGCPLQVSGPAAGLVVVVTELVQQHGIESLGIIIMLAGALQVAAGLLGFGMWFRGVPPSVIHGMLSGIGLLLICSQFHVMVDSTPKGGAIENLAGLPEALYKGLWISENSTHHLAAMIGVATIAVVILWDKMPFHKFPKALRWIEHIPGALVAIVAATALDGIFNLPIKSVQLPANLFQDLRLPTINSFGHMANWELLFDAMAVAFVATCETMLTSTAVDKMAVGHRTKYDKELKAQGVGNLLCGFIGGLPMTGVIVRSGVNVRAGARTRLSSMLHGVWLLAFVSCLPSVVRMIPVSSLAALLVLTGYKLLTAPEAKELRKHGRSEVSIFFITMAVVVLVDLLTGVLVGVVLSTAKLLYHFSHLEVRTVKDDASHKTILYLRGAATFLSLPFLAQAVDDVPPDSELHVHLEELDYIDHACLDLLMNWDKQHRASGGNLVIDWGTLGAMYRDRRKRPRSGMRTKELTDPKLLQKIVNGETAPVSGETATVSGETAPVHGETAPVPGERPEVERESE
ncbi:MAG TPA: SulP family inorganic anion transporter [Candidatus Obscuribacterales bacterium]